MVLGVSLVKFAKEFIHHRVTEDAQRTTEFIFPTDSKGVPTRILTDTRGLLPINRDSTYGYFLSTLRVELRVSHATAKEVKTLFI